MIVLIYRPDCGETRSHDGFHSRFVVYSCQDLDEVAIRIVEEFADSDINLERSILLFDSLEALTSNLGAIERELFLGRSLTGIYYLSYLPIKIETARDFEEGRNAVVELVALRWQEHLAELGRKRVESHKRVEAEKLAKIEEYERAMLKTLKAKYEKEDKT